MAIPVIAASAATLGRVDIAVLLVIPVTAEFPAILASAATPGSLVTAEFPVIPGHPDSPARMAQQLPVVFLDIPAKAGIAVFPEPLGILEPLEPLASAVIPASAATAGFLVTAVIAGLQVIPDTVG